MKFSMNIVPLETTHHSYLLPLSHSGEKASF